MVTGLTGKWRDSLGPNLGKSKLIANSLVLNLKPPRPYCDPLLGPFSRVCGHPGCENECSSLRTAHLIKGMYSLKKTYTRSTSHHTNWQLMFFLTTPVEKHLFICQSTRNLCSPFVVGKTPPLIAVNTRYVMVCLFVYFYVWWYMVYLSRNSTPSNSQNRGVFFFENFQIFSADKHVVKEFLTNLHVAKIC